jgi:hypothetical protein
LGDFELTDKEAHFRVEKTTLKLDFANFLDVQRKRFKQMKDAIYAFTESSQQKLDVNRSF